MLNEQMKIVLFESPSMTDARIKREFKKDCIETSDTFNKKLQNENISDRQKLEYQMMVALGDGNEDEFQKLSKILESINTIGIRVIKGRKENDIQ
jgi:hypothetical protein